MLTQQAIAQDQCRRNDTEGFIAGIMGKSGLEIGMSPRGHSTLDPLSFFSYRFGLGCIPSRIGSSAILLWIILGLAARVVFTTVRLS